MDLVERLRGMAKSSFALGGERNALEKAANRIETLVSALDDLAEAARNACDARRHTPLIDALAEADRLLSKTVE